MQRKPPRQEERERKMNEKMNLRENERREIIWAGGLVNLG